MLIIFEQLWERSALLLKILFRRCPMYMYRCNYGACVSRIVRCNGLADCVDASDEIACDRDANNVCSDRNFQCSTVHQECISLAEVCNGL